MAQGNQYYLAYLPAKEKTGEQRILANLSNPKKNPGNT